MHRTRQTQEERAAESGRLLFLSAVELFSEQGYERTTTEQIAARAGYSRAMVNARYGSKAGLLDTLLGAAWEERLISAAYSGVTGLERILGVFGELERILNDEPVALRAFMVVSFEAAGPSAELRGLVTERLRRIEDAFAAAIATGTRDGSISPRLTPTAEAREIAHNGLGAMYRWIVDTDGFDFAEHLRASRDRLVERLAA